MARLKQYKYTTISAYKNGQVTFKENYFEHFDIVSYDEFKKHIEAFNDVDTNYKYRITDRQNDYNLGRY